MKSKIRLEKTEEGDSVSCPGLPGCWSQGDTETEALENIQDAIPGINYFNKFQKPDRQGGPD